MDDDHDLGLPHDLGAILTRRRALFFLGSATALISGGCDQIPFIGRSEAEVAATGTDGKACIVHPGETQGPFPADGSNNAHGTLANVLSDTGIVRKDMRPNLGKSDTIADGVELRLTAKLVAVGPGCKTLAGCALYVWHCDAEGRYSLYELADATYLRAVGVTDANGEAQFVTVVPGCYRGRYPHIHFEVYSSLDKATDYRNRLLTSQLAIPAEACTEVYHRDPAYRDSIANFASSPLERDGIFRDNTPKQLAAQTLSMTKAADGSYDATVLIGINSTAL